MILWTALPVFAQSQLPGQLDSADKLLGGDEQQFNLETDTGLAGTDIRKTVGQVINVILGLLGVVAIGFILYGGFLWMTSAGNDDQIETAKKLLLNATIGLVVVLSAFAITSFVISRLISSTGEGGVGDGSGGGGGGGGTLPSDIFSVRAIQPQGQQTIMNLKVRVFFTRPVLTESVTSENVQVLKNSTEVVAVIPTFSIDKKTMTLTPENPCPAPKENLKCFESGITYLVRVSPGKELVSTDTPPKDLVCGLGSVCQATFIAGDKIDETNPVVAITSPTGGFVSENAAVPILFRATDDAGVAQVEVAVDGNVTGTITPNGDTPLELTGAVTWNTPAYKAGDVYTLRATAYDVDDHTGLSPSVLVSLRPSWCFNAVQDIEKNETGVDCGGECGACDGGACSKDSDCASGACKNNVCVSPPVITRVAPTEASPGGIITVDGKNFGSTQGIVTMLGDITKTSDDEDGTNPPAICGGAIQWTDTRIVFAVGNGFQTGPVRVKTSTSIETDTSGTSKSVKVDVKRAAQSKPGICKVEPTAAAPGEIITVKGFGLGPSTAPAPTVTISGKPTAAPASWGAAFVEGIVVPSLSPGVADIIVKPFGSVDSNPLAFKVLPTPQVPNISEVSPTQGPLGSYVTIRGSNFGTGGTVRFLNSAAATFEDGELADVTFPRACSAGVWKPSEVLVKVPRTITVQPTPYRIVMKVGNALSNEASFTVTQGTARPGICLLDPNNGPLGLPLTVYGERLGSSEGSIEFYDAQESAASKQLAPVTVWRDSEVKAAVPFQSTPGPAHVKARRASTQTGGLQVGGDPSNSLLFTIQNCLDEKKPSESCAAVTPGTKCCSDGACRTQCVPAGKQCQYEWSFTTSASPTDEDQPPKKCTDAAQCGGAPCKNGVCAIPYVMERKVCDKDEQNPMQSPSPYKNTTDACPNAKIVVQFSEEMKDATLVERDNFEVFRCAAGTTDDCTTDVELASWDESAIIEHKTLQLTPTATLAYNTWYLARIRSDATAQVGVRSEEFGVLLDGNRDNVPGDPYEWLFKTASTNCTADAARVMPTKATIATPSGSQEFIGLASRGANCNVINYTGSWGWSSSAPLVASIGPSSTAQATAWPKKETEEKKPVLITARPLVDPAIADGKLKTAKLTIVYEAPRILEAWPNCSAACTNIEIGARFSAPIDPTTLTAKDQTTGKYTNVSLHRCLTGDVRLETAGLFLEAGGKALLSAGKAASTSAVELDKLIGGETTPDVPVSEKIKSAVTAAIDAGETARNTVSDLYAAADKAEKSYGTNTPPEKLTNLKAYISTELTSATAAIKRAQEKSAPTTLDDARAVSTEIAGLGSAVTALATSIETQAGEFTKSVQCTLANQSDPLPISSIGYNKLTKTMRFYAPATDPLQPSTLYRVLIKGGPGGVLGEDTNKDLAIDKSRGVTKEQKGGETYAAWMFATKEAPATCALASVELAPKELIVNAVDEKSPYASTARGSPDACNPQGQRIDPFAYDWTWESPNREKSVGKPPVATFAPFATHVYGGSTYQSPDQKAKSLAEGKATMRAGSAGKEDTGTYEVKCGYTTNTQCVNANGGDIRYGLMSGSSCCSIRPTVELKSPKETKDVCRNEAISLRFSKKMDEKTLTGNILLQKIEGDTRTTISTTLTTTHGVEESTVAVVPLGMLGENTKNMRYAVVVKGELRAADATKTIRSATGVALADDVEFTFVTGTKICKISKVEIQVYDERNATLDTPISEWVVLKDPDFFRCAGRNDCRPDDTEPETSGNQHWYRAVPFDQDGHELVAKSTLWDVVSGIDIVTLPATPTPAQPRTSVTSTAKNGVATVQAVVSGTPEEGSGTKTIDVTAFICENPWPSLDKFPWEDAAASLKWTGTTPYTNMQFYYCRDAGKPGTQDDLPALRTPLKVPEQSAAQSVIKEYLLPVCPAGEANCGL